MGASKIDCYLLLFLTFFTYQSVNINSQSTEQNVSNHFFCFSSFFVKLFDILVWWVSSWLVHPFISNITEEYWKSLMVVEESENKKINESNSAINSDKGQNTVYLHSLMLTYNQRRLLNVHIDLFTVAGYWQLDLYFGCVSHLQESAQQLWNRGQNRKKYFW